MADAGTAGPAAPPSAPPRRSFLARLVGGSLLALAGSYAAGALVYLAPANRSLRKGTGPLDGGPEADLPLGQAKVVANGDEPVLVVRTAAGLVAMSAVCTHLGCRVAWDAARGQVRCPCHAATFDSQGNVVDGPAPRGLENYPVGVQDGRIVIQRT